MAVIGDENAGRAPAPFTQGSSALRQQRRRSKETLPLNQRLSEEAHRLRKEAQGTQPGFERERLIRRARYVEAASHAFEWLSSTGLRPPK